MLETAQNIHKKFGMKTQLNMLSDYENGFPTEQYYIDCIAECLTVVKWKSNTLINIINKHEKKFNNDLINRLSKGTYIDTDKIVHNAGVKFKGNLLEIITEQLCRDKAFTYDPELMVEFDHVIGSDEDLGIDILMVHRNNKKWKVGLQIKFRTVEEIDYKSGALSKTSDMVRRAMEKDLNEKRITIDEYIDWIQNCNTKEILVTTTDGNYKLPEKLPDLVIINKEKLLNYIKDNCSMWERLHKELLIEKEKQY